MSINMSRPNRKMDFALQDALRGPELKPHPMYKQVIYVNAVCTDRVWQC